jgi:flagellar biosynthetic protein FliP
MMRYIISFFFLSIQLTYSETFSIDFGEMSGSMSGRVIQLFMLFTVLSLAPSIIIMLTSFTRLVVTLSFLRSALGLQQSPPNVVLVSLALFLTGFIMAPTLEMAYTKGVEPYIEQRIDEKEAFEKIAKPFRAFMFKQTREKDLKLFVDLSNSPKTLKDREALSLGILIPAFIISELRRAFEIGFIIFLPFLIIDMVVASVLMGMGMMMLPPVMIAMPFKLIFFVLVDGWHLICGSLVRSFGVTGGG